VSSGIKKTAIADIIIIIMGRRILLFITHLKKDYKIRFCNVKLK